MNFYDISSINIIQDTIQPEVPLDISQVNGVTVLTPLYNGVQYLEQSVESVIKQTYDKWQLIIGINGHNESSEVEQLANVIIDKLNPEKKYNILVKYYSTRGKANTLNSMVKDAIYNHIALLDVDDNWVSNKLELQLPYLKDYDVVGGKCEYFGDKTGSPPIPLGNFSSTHNIFEYNPVINSSVILHKRDAVWDDEQFVRAIPELDDYSLWFKLFFQKRKFYNINKVLCNHRVHIDSAFNYKCADNVDTLKQLWNQYYSTH